MPRTGYLNNRDNSLPSSNIQNTREVLMITSVWRLLMVPISAGDMKDRHVGSLFLVKRGEDVPGRHDNGRKG